MIFGEERDALAFHVENTDSAILHDQRNGELRAIPGWEAMLARIGGGIEYPNGLSRFHSRAGYALAQRDIVDLHALVEANAKTVAEDVAIAARP